MKKILDGTAYQESFLRYMLRQNLNVTRQRLGIAEFFFGLEGHHTQEEIYSMLKDVDPGIGQTTVYRTLKLLCEAGLALELQFGDGVARFEPVTANTHHDHLICRQCGQAVEFHSTKIESLQNEVAKRYGYKLLGHAHYLYGLCPACQEQSELEEAESENAQ